MKKKNPFMGRSLAVAGDLNTTEQAYLYKKTAILKKAWNSGADLGDFRINDPELAIYLMFLENSTRTKESFRNAACFHNVKLNIFDAASSSFNKAESLVDSVKMLFGYSRRSIFVMRTKMEGVCKALDEQIGAYADRLGRERPIFINGGDGRHEHPTQEYLDEFTFLEHCGWDDSHLHIALVGDLFHGRTVHSKADGLRVFRSVTIDLVAPQELSLPVEYRTRMLEHGFELREWPSIEAYLASKDVSPLWYFTRLQLERMGDEIRDREDILRDTVSFHEKFLPQLPEGTRFFHPLPRHREKSVIPSSLDRTALNGWDEQSINGFFTRIVELAMVAGKIGDDFEGSPKIVTKDKTFITEVPITRKSRVEDRYKVGIKPVNDGIVIDHIAKGSSIQEIWDHLDKVRRILKLNFRSSHGVFHGNNTKEFKGIISLPALEIFDYTELKKLAAVSPGCTLNLIKNQSVLRKYRLAMPPKIYNFTEISCKNPLCITFPQASEHVPPYFLRCDKEFFICHYCSKRHMYGDIWDI